MKNLLSQLHSNEAILLMYLADELPARDRVEVEHVLSRDGGMRRQLEELRRTMEVVDRSMADDAGLSLRAEKCAVETIAAMRRWQVAPPPNRLEFVVEERKLLLPWWTYPLAAAASVLVAAAVFFANMEPSQMSAPVSETVAANIPDLLSSQVLGDLSNYAMDPFAQHAMAEDLAASFDESQRVLGEILPEGAMLDARREVTTLQALSQDAFASVDWRW